MYACTCTCTVMQNAIMKNSLYVLRCYVFLVPICAGVLNQHKEGKLLAIINPLCEFLVVCSKRIFDVRCFPIVSLFLFPVSLCLK